MLRKRYSRAAPFDVKRFCRSARPAGLEPAASCLEGSCSIRLSYGRSEISVADEDHASATYGSQCVATSRSRAASLRASAGSGHYEHQAAVTPDRGTPSASAGFPPHPARATRHDRQACRNAAARPARPPGSAGGTPGQPAPRTRSTPTSRPGTAQPAPPRPSQKTQKTPPAPAAPPRRTAARWSYGHGHIQVAHRIEHRRQHRPHCDHHRLASRAHHLQPRPQRQRGPVALRRQPQVGRSRAEHSQRRPQQPRHLVRVPGHLHREARHRVHQRHVLRRLVGAARLGPRRRMRRC